MLTVNVDGLQVEPHLLKGALACPGCEGVLARWGHARRRVIRTLCTGITLMLRPRRAICRGCGVTHVPLPARLLLRRADEVAVIGAALERAARGQGHVRIARALGRPVGTVRSWVRRARRRAGRVRAALAGWVVALDPDPPPVTASGSALGDALSMLAAVHRAARARWPGVVAGAEEPRSLVDTMSLWRLAAVLTNASLLAPVLTVRMINTNEPLVTLCA